MAARDDTYRNQRTLDLVFGVSCLAMVGSLFWMFAKDYNREFKTVQRRGREVEVAVLQQQARAAAVNQQAAVDQAFNGVLQELRKLNIDTTRFERQYNLLGPETPGSSVPDGLTAATFLKGLRAVAANYSNADVQQWERELTSQARPDAVRLNDKLAAEKATRDSLVSRRDILVQQHALEAAVEEVVKEIEAKEKDVAELEVTLEKATNRVKDLQDKIASAKSGLTAAIDNYEEKARDRDRALRTASQKEFGPGAKFRAAPIVDAFNSPFKIDQKIPDGLFIDYNFKPVPRNDRCMTCHMFSDRLGFDKDTLRELFVREKLSPADQAKLQQARDQLAKLDDEEARIQEELKSGTDAKSQKKLAEADKNRRNGRLAEIARLKRDLTAQINRLVPQEKLTASEVAVYCNHPRMDLFVGSNSPHPVEKFGCTICHAGQGGSATFGFAYHFPDRGKTDGLRPESYPEKKARWEKEFDWKADLHPDYLWDFPMIPARYQEATCLKCHHQVTDLIRTDGKEEAPRLIKGYRLVRDLGCFGCHEIAGYKGGRAIGPDLRLEPFPPLDDLSVTERARANADPMDPPGSQRKVGPGMRRIAEKTTEEWAKRWIRSPRSFRPDTKMPHFFGVTNNTPGKLSDVQDGDSQLAEGQQGYPDAEINAIAFYLFKASERYLTGVKDAQAKAKDEEKVREAFLAEDTRRREDDVYNKQVPRENALREFTAGADLLKDDPKTLTKDQLQRAVTFLAERDRMLANARLQEAVAAAAKELGDYQGNAENGKTLFTKKGCLACHSHGAVEVYDNFEKSLTNADFGPNLSNLKDKLAAYGKNEAAARSWLFSWLTEPMAYHPRTKMPNPRLEAKERADVIAWLLGPGNLGLPKPETNHGHPDFAGLKVEATNEALEGLAREYLGKALPRLKIDGAIKEGLTGDEANKELRLRPDAFERALIKDGNPLFANQADRLRYYVGQKAVNRLGCYACHDIPGFEQAKPIGTALNDWGKKDPDRLAFENIMAYVNTFHQVPGHGEENGHGNGNGASHAVHGGHGKAYDPFFYEALAAAKRDGFLYQKLSEPRSYDYNKLKERPWDDRLRMPQFKFAHVRPTRPEAEALAAQQAGKATAAQAKLAQEFHAREVREEQEAVEAVMTFVLGLVADPIPPKFLHQPKPDRANEIRGLKVAEKYNCVSCHVLKPGKFEGDPRRPLTDDTADTMLARLLKVWNNESKQKELRELDYPFPEHSSWRQQLVAANGKMTVSGLVQKVDTEDNVLSIELWEAIRFQDNKGNWQNFPAALNVLQLPVNAKNGWTVQPPTGGQFAHALAKVLDRSDQNRNPTWSSVPPVLLREGQKVQPQWLYEFLLNPHPIRPMVAVNLRMPRFNMSEDEAEALVHYFVAVDRLTDPALGTEYFTRSPVQREPLFQQDKRVTFRQRADQAAAGKPADANAAKGDDYFEAGWRMLTSKKMCLNCHNIGTFKSEGGQAAPGGPVQRGPSLHMAADRLRPDYVERYVTYPNRIIPYTVMAQYPPLYEDYHKIADADFKAVMGESGPALSAHERLRAVRDALFSWGYLTDPQRTPTGQKAGPRGDAHSWE